MSSSESRSQGVHLFIVRFARTQFIDQVHIAAFSIPYPDMFQSGQFMKDRRNSVASSHVSNDVVTRRRI